MPLSRGSCRIPSHARFSGPPHSAHLQTPTRPLSACPQTHKFARDFAHFTDLRLCLLVGGDALEAQFAELAANPDVLIATPGRLMHHLSEVEGMSLKAVQVAVLDEADRLFEMGFAEQIRDIWRGLPEDRQTLLFSATMPTQLAEFAQVGLRAPAVVRLDAEATLSDRLRLAFFVCRQDDKPAALLHLLREARAPPARSRSAAPPGQGAPVPKPAVPLASPPAPHRRVPPRTIARR